MISANELRIGNYLTYHTPDDTDVPCKIDAQDIYNISINYMLNAEIHSPIPLTEEILLKCGFEETYRSEFRIRYDHKDFMFIGYDINLSGIDNTATGLRYYGSHIKVEYLHDLQNAFKVFTGQELTINL